MSSGCGDVLSLEDLKTAKKHQTFEAEVITGKQGGVPSGADIDYATNQVTGQVQKTMPAILRDIGFEPASFDFTSGGTLGVNDRNKAVLWPVADGGDGNYYAWGGALPKVIPAASTPASTGGLGPGAWRPVTDIVLRDDLANVTKGDALIAVKQPYSGSAARTQHDHNADYVSVKDFGAVGDGVTDDTAAIEAAWLAVTTKGSKYFPQHAVGESIYTWLSVNGPKLFFPAGRYIYRGAGLNLNDTVNQVPLFTIVGESRSATEIWLDGDMYFVDSAVNPYQFKISHLKCYSGLGLAKFSSTAENVSNLSEVSDCMISAYRECGVGMVSSGWPNVKILRNQFYGRTGYQTIGVMMSGWCASSEIVSNEFGLAEGAGVHAYAIKLTVTDGYGPTTPILVADNGVYRRNSVDGSTALWVVPNPLTSDNAGRAVMLRNNKWGAENINSSSYHVLIADESTGTGTWAGNRRHGTNLSSGYVRGLIFDKNNVRFETDATQPYIATFTPHIQNFVCEDIIDNSLPVNYIEYRGGMSNLSFGPRDGNIYISTRYWLAPTSTNYGVPVAALTNFPHTIRLADEMNYLNTRISATYSGDSSVNFASLMTVSTSASGLANGLTKTVIDNSIGVPSEACSLVASSSVGRISYPLSGWTNDRVVWIEMELARDGATPMGSVIVEVSESDSVIYARRTYSLTSEWRMIRFPVSIPNGASTVNLRVVAQGYSAAANTFKIGRVAAYHASLPINTGHVRSIGSAWNSQHITLGSYHLWVDASGVLRIKNGIPTSGTDGTVIGSQS